ncbi:MAG: hypothetical protein IPJ46_22745 [Anaerolineales bacterium]|nr:hypothetical protein [Anaerolineales bacterium]
MLVKLYQLLLVPVTSFLASTLTDKKLRCRLIYNMPGASTTLIALQMKPPNAAGLISKRSTVHAAHCIERRLREENIFRASKRSNPTRSAAKCAAPKKVDAVCAGSVSDMVDVDAEIDRLSRLDGTGPGQGGLLRRAPCAIKCGL